jgi:sterol desaturase/sphingolipid hydroxylase (fatty acid hydroxylase superfamily)
MKLEDLLGLAIFVSYGMMLLVEALFPARAYPTRRLWRVRGALFLVGMAVVATFTPLLLPTEWLAAHRLLDGSSLGLGLGTVVGYAAVSLAAYVYHRAAHRIGVLWRTFHQMHHAPQRMDMGGAAIFHPLEIVVFVSLSTVTTTLVLGLSPEAAALTGFVAQFYSFFQHLNVKTPRLLGYFIQRPEAHFVHHSRDVHAYNYGDLPIWDILFGTFKNPAEYGAGEVGFESPADGRYGAMLLTRDVSNSIGTRVALLGPGPQQPTKQTGGQTALGHSVLASGNG